MVDMAYCKTCRRAATKHAALTMTRCPDCGGTDYILPGISPDDLATYYADRGQWDNARAALLAADLAPWDFNARYGEMMTMRECVAWVEHMELFALDMAQLHNVITEQYDRPTADWYCDDYLGGYEQRWQTSASAKARGRTD